MNIQKLTDLYQSIEYDRKQSERVCVCKSEIFTNKRSGETFPFHFSQLNN